jgi:hypothetical protein
MTESTRYIDTPSGALKLKVAKIRLSTLKLPPTGDDNTLSIEDFVASVAGICVPSSVILNTPSKEMTDAEHIFQTAAAAFEQNLADLIEVTRRTAPAEDMRAESAAHGDRAAGNTASLRVNVASTGSASLSISSGGAGAGTSSSAGGSPGDSAVGGKRQRLGMSDSDLARACTIMDMPAARVTPQFLMDKPNDVRLYTPLLVDLYANVRKVADGISLLAREIFTFEGDFLELSSATVAALPTTPLYASCDTASGSRLLHRLEMVHAAAALLRAKNLRCQRAFWLANHTPGCNWDTWEQLCHREDQDAGADLCNPCFTPLTSWEDQVKAAIVAARQEAAALSKDGKTLLGPILPRLMARHNHSKGPEWRSKSTIGNKGGDKPPVNRHSFIRRARPPSNGNRKPGVTGKENVRAKSAASPASGKTAGAGAASGP